MNPSIFEFFKRFGKDTTNNIQLINFAKQLKLKPFKVLMRNELKKAKPGDYIITNIHESDEPGIHWNCFHKNFFFDSYGLPPCKEIKQLLKNGIYSEFNIQEFNQKFCGVMSLYVLYMLSKGYKFEDIVLYLYTNKLIL